MPYRQVNVTEMLRAFVGALDQNNRAIRFHWGRHQDALAHVLVPQTSIGRKASVPGA